MIVLIVDDHVESRYFLESLLTAKGHTVRTAANGAEALEILKNDDIDLIISDIRMPEMDGFQLCRTVKKDPALCRIPFIFYTATYTGPKDEEFALKIGADRFIVKPCEPDEFLHAVEAVTAEAVQRLKQGHQPPQEEEVYKLYSERLVRKLEQKMQQAEQELRAREDAEKALRASEKRLLRAQRIAKMGDFTWDLNSGEVTWSDSLYDLLKYDKSEPIDYTTVNEKIHHPEDVERVIRWFDECIASGRGELTPNEYRVLCKDGEDKYVRTMGVIEKKEGKPFRVFATVQDITERKQAEIELRNLKEELEVKVAERTRELQEKVEKLDKGEKAMLYMVEDLNNITAELKKERRNLQAVNKELEAFSYSVSHDLRAPLRAIDGFSRILEEEYSQVLDKEGRRLLGVVRDNTEKMDRLINDILELSRTGKAAMNVSEIDMRAMATSMYNEIASPEEKETFEFIVHDLPKVTADPNLMRRVWSNLISNAVKYTMPQERRVIEITGSEEEDRCIFSVRDSGVGFNPDYSAKLFMLFQRLHGADEFEGTGVGLAIVEKIVHRHGGSIWAEGEEGKGAVFSFALPKKAVVEKGGHG